MYMQCACTRDFQSFPTICIILSRLMKEKEIEREKQDLT